MARGGGGGDAALNKGTQEGTWGRLPLLVQLNICKYFNQSDLNKMRRTCKDIRHMIEQQFGLHVKLPARNFSGWLFNNNVIARTGQNITDRMIRRAVLAMEGKAIRTLEMNESPPGVNAFPVERYIQRPFKLRHLSLKYVDVRLIHKLLTSCGNLSTLEYETGLYRPLPHGPLALLFLATSYQPVPIPSMNQEFIGIAGGLPTTFQLRNLTSLSLSLCRISTFHKSDWVNVVYLLLALPSSTVNLTTFKFLFRAGLLISLKDYLQVIAIVGHFISRSPSLQHIKYQSYTRFTDHPEIPELPQYVMSFLIEKFGSELLKDIRVPAAQNLRDPLLIVTRQLMREAGRNLRHLQDLELRVNDELQLRAFNAFLCGLPSLVNCHIEDIFDLNRIPQDNDLYNLLVAQDEADEVYLPLFANIEKLSMVRNCAGNMPAIRSTSLTPLVERMRNLKHLELNIADAMVPEEAFWILGGEENNFQVQQPNQDGLVVINQGANINQRPDFTIPAPPDEAIFHQIEVLKLLNVTLLTRDARQLKKWINLRELYLDLNPGYRHSHFGMNSGDLLELIQRLRKLEKLSVNLVYLPQDNNALAEAHERALMNIGRLEARTLAWAGIHPRAHSFVFDRAVEEVIDEE